MTYTIFIACIVIGGALSLLALRRLLRRKPNSLGKYRRGFSVGT